jgi:hypothetical protein
MTFSGAVNDFELIAQQVSGLAEKIDVLTRRVNEVERVNARLEEAALTTARALEEISAHWDAVYEAIRRKSESDQPVGPQRPPEGHPEPLA